jgi:hypothetical protein
LKKEKKYFLFTPSKKEKEKEKLKHFRCKSHQHGGKLTATM